MTDHPITFSTNLARSTIATNQYSYGSSLPIAYRLVTKPDGSGNDVPALQGYYAWVGNSGTGGEWRTLETQDCSLATDKIPHPDLP